MVFPIEIGSFDPLGLFESIMRKQQIPSFHLSNFLNLRLLTTHQWHNLG